jgi:hypothetical protein
VLFIGVVIAAVVLLGVMAPTILKLMIAIIWGIVIFIAAQLVLGGALALVLPAALFPARPEDAHASSDEAPAPDIGERPTACADAILHADHASEETASQPARSIPRSLSEAVGRDRLPMVHSSTGSGRCQSSGSWNSSRASARPSC